MVESASRGSPGWSRRAFLKLSGLALVGAGTDPTVRSIQSSRRRRQRHVLDPGPTRRVPLHDENRREGANA